MLARCGTYVHVAPFYYYVHHSITLVASIFIIFEHRYLPYRSLEYRAWYSRVMYTYYEKSVM